MARADSDIDVPDSFVPDTVKATAAPVDTLPAEALSTNDSFDTTDNAQPSRKHIEFIHFRADKTATDPCGFSREVITCSKEPTLKIEALGGADYGCDNNDAALLHAKCMMPVLFPAKHNADIPAADFSG